MKPCIVFQTDFGTGWGAVASMKGVCKQVDPALECVDLTHEIAQYDILAASRELAYVLPFWPAGTVFVSVVDPGVGTDRRACVALLENGSYVVTPDNGTLTHAAWQIGVRAVRQIDEGRNRYPGTEDVAVFHGRDLFAYTAARLAAGVIDYAGVGPAYDPAELVLFDAALVMAKTADGAAEGVVSSVSDPFGSVAFNVLSADLRAAGFRHGDRARVTLAREARVYYDEAVLYERSFGFVPLGEPILFDSSTNYIELGLNQDSFQKKYAVQQGDAFTLTRL